MSHYEKKTIMPCLQCSKETGHLDLGYAMPTHIRYQCCECGQYNKANKITKTIYQRVDGKDERWERVVPFITWAFLSSIVGYFWLHIIWWAIR